MIVVMAASNPTRCSLSIVLYIDDLVIIAVVRLTVSRLLSIFQGKKYSVLVKILGLSHNDVMILITNTLMSMHKKFIIIIGGGVKINLSSRNTNATIFKKTDILNISIVSKMF